MPPWSGERKQAVLGEQVLDLHDLPLAPDEVGELQGQIVVPRMPENWRPWELDHRTEVARCILRRGLWGVWHRCRFRRLLFARGKHCSCKGTVLEGARPFLMRAELLRTPSR
jgi:hypothetical protein